MAFYSLSARVADNANLIQRRRINRVSEPGRTSGPSLLAIEKESISACFVSILQPRISDKSWIELRKRARNAQTTPYCLSLYGSYCVVFHLESRLGYWLLLGNTRHCGLWEKDTIWPFPVNKGQRAMEEKLHNRLGLKPGSKVLDAGAGSGYVAMYMAEKGLDVTAIDITPLHVESAKRNVKYRGLQDKISVHLEDYHNLTRFADNSFDGIYTMETFVHADDPVKVLRNFYRILRPGGVLVQHEADWNKNSELLQEVLRLSHCQNTLEQGALSRTLEQVGFKSIDLEDLSERVLPFWRFLGWVGYIPYQILRPFNLQSRFTNILAAVAVYQHWDEGRYISVRAVKP
ncbi:hypothetical protein PRK78_007518 [Emydomyces testavorans]|uniref:Methyltransferase type 11 domain-containing protein n=1 Tax=Emydomyces testavorans TaxID=2070801 RepID=A0AAF0DPE9_9EURO|nr:hypothetical protein PRK78_007518 [Emydomyces testavorans]